jgi:hypothetical protein
VNEKLSMVFVKFNEGQLWDNISMMDGEDSSGEHYCIFDQCEDVNKFTAHVIEILGLDVDTKDYEIESELETNFVFSDEYTTCDDCGHVVRTSPNSYGWQPDYYMGDGFIVCGDCFRNNEEYQENYLQDKINNSKSAVNGLIKEDQLNELGFSKWNKDSYESEWYDGQNDDPAVIYDKLQDGYRDIIFFIDSTGQFDIHFSVWIR